MKTTVMMQVGRAKKDLISAVNAIQQKYDLSATLLDGMLCAVLADVRSGEIAEIIDSANIELEAALKNTDETE